MKIGHLVSCSKAIDLLLTNFFSGAIIDLADGSRVSYCPLPCKTTQTQTKLLHEDKGVDTMIDITFSSKIKQTKTDLVKPTLSSFLSEVRFCHEN